MNLPSFNKEEFDLLSNAEVLIRKRIIQDKIFTLLNSTREHIADTTGFSPSKLNLSGKISRGENYLNLPYLILDYPAIFKRDSIFACRTMFLWGNFFSTTVHLQGINLANNKSQLLKLLKDLETSETFISQGETPWHYHYNKDNYLPINDATVVNVKSKNFIKISKRIPLSEHSSLPELAVKFYKPFLTSLKLYV